MFRSLWGLGGYGLGESVDKITSAGYCGIEASLADLGSPNSLKLQQNVKIIKQNGLDLIVGIYSGWTDYDPNHCKPKTVKEHLQQWQNELHLALSLDPVHINSHSGSDLFSLEESEYFFKEALETIHSLGLHSKPPFVSHETHRGRALYHPAITLHLLKKFPSLKLTLDMSHWAVVTERLTEGCWFGQDDKTVWREIVNPRIAHIHARIGSNQHAQTTNPTPSERNFYEEIWTGIFKQKMKENDGRTFFPVTPEYGPPPYLELSNPQLDHDKILWELVEREKNYVRNLWSSIDI